MVTEYAYYPWHLRRPADDSRCSRCSRRPRWAHTLSHDGARSRWHTRGQAHTGEGYGVVVTGWYTAQGRGDSNYPWHGGNLSSRHTAHGRCSHGARTHARHGTRWRWAHAHTRTRTRAHAHAHTDGTTHARTHILTQPHTHTHARVTLNP